MSYGRVKAAHLDQTEYKYCAAAVEAPGSIVCGDRAAAGLCAERGGADAPFLETVGIATHHGGVIVVVLLVCGRGGKIKD